MADAPDVAIVGGGIVGCALAAFLVEDGASVVLYERDRVGAAASGRNSGVLQDPMDPELRALHARSLVEYGALPGFALPADPAGILVVAEDPAALRAELSGLDHAPLRPEWLDAAALRALEPALADGLAGVRLDTGRPVPPAAATAAFAARARRGGAVLREGAAAAPAPGGVRVDGALEPAGAVVVAAGPWTPELVDPTGRWRPIQPVWGVVAEVRLADPPRHVIEETGVERIAADPEAVPSVFSLVTADGVSSLGSTFLPERPDPGALAPRLRDRGARFVPALAAAAITGVRACARPQSLDGRPLLGRAGELWVAAGHGPWGISTGPGSARVLAAALLAGDPIPAALDAARVPGA